MDQEFILLIILIFFTGVAAGYMSGLFGIGSGILIVPAAIFLLDIGFREAKALSLFVIMFVSPIGMWRHHGHGNLHPKTGLILGIPGACGSLLGVYIAGLLNTSHLKVLFAIVQFMVAYRMIHRSGHALKQEGLTEAYNIHRNYLPVVGFVGGLAAGMLGIGGGVIMVPSMVMLSYPIHSAIANSLMVVFINSTAATGAHAIRGDLDIIQAIPMMLGAVLSVRKGADMSVSIDREKLRKYFGYFLIVVGLYMLYKSYIG